MKKLKTACTLALAAALTPGLFAQEADNTDAPIFDLEEMVITGLKDFSSGAFAGETPVSFSELSKEEITRALGSQDIPMVLNTTPSVYATQEGGGAGDARVNVRGFNQRNVAIMINGVPVNDMENGWVYWSNWDGVGDVSANIQVQRGMSNINLATPSIGGTMNIVTDPAATKRGGSMKMEAGSGAFKKVTATYNTGLINDKFALQVSGVKKYGDGMVDATWTDAWAWYIGATYILNEKHRFDFFALGAPQRHGQNTYEHNIGTYNHDYALSLDGYDAAALDKFDERGWDYNENWNYVDESYTGRQYWNGSTHDRQYSDILNERENYFHKPQVNFNWYYTISEELELTSVFYYSGGEGGGTGTYGYVYRDRNAPGNTYNNRDWNYQIEYNTSARYDYDGFWKPSDQSTGILRNSVNNQWSIGAISKLDYKPTEELSFQFGLDWRTAEMEHFREVRDLLGGNYYIDADWNDDLGVWEDPSSDFWTADEYARGLGDKIAYFNENNVDWLGFFAQGEYKTDNLTAFGSVGWSSISYEMTDYFKDDGTGNPLKLESGDIDGYQIKGGVMYDFTDMVSGYVNAGYVSKVPIFDGVIDDSNGVLNDDPDNEKFTSMEIGFIFSMLEGKMSATVDYYHTNWKDRTITRNFTERDAEGNVLSEGVYNMSGLDSTHSGFEAELAYQPVDWVRFDVAASIGDWSYDKDVHARYDDDDRDIHDEMDLSIGGLKVGDAPQTQFAYAVTFEPNSDLWIKLQGRYYVDHYADFDPVDRSYDANDSDSVPDRAQAWKIPSANIYDLHLNYDVPEMWDEVDISLFLHVFNIFDETYISDATDNDYYNGFDGDHDADDAAIHLGGFRSMNAGVKLRF